MTTDPQPAALYRRIRGTVSRRLARGAVLLLPLLVTFWLFRFAFDTLDGLLQPAIAAVAGDEIPGLSFAIIIVALLLVGALSSHLVFRTLGALFERGVTAVPGVGSVYGTTRKLLADSEGGGPTPTGFETVVRIEYPRRGVWSVGFLMGVIDVAGTRFGVVYMPSTPLPQSGWLAQLPLDEIELLNWNSAQAMQYIVSAGVSCPESAETSAIEPSS